MKALALEGFQGVQLRNSSAGGSGVMINWPDDVGIGGAAAAADDDDDLYG